MLAQVMLQLWPRTAGAVYKVCNVSSRIRYALTRSFRPLFAARIALRECDTFFFGAAKSRPSHSSADGAAQASGTAAGAPDKASDGRCMDDTRSQRRSKRAESMGVRAHTLTGVVRCSADDWVYENGSWVFSDESTKRVRNTAVIACDILPSVSMHRRSEQAAKQGRPSRGEENQDAATTFETALT